MAKNTHFLICFLCAFLCCNTALFGSSQLGGIDKRAQIVSAFQSELALKVREATGKNDGYHVEKYLKAVNQKKGLAWCAAFVVYVLKSCNVNTENASAWAPSLFPKKHLVYEKASSKSFTVLPGDVVGFYYANLGRIGHVGFAEEIKDNSIITVEGNTNGEGSREGNGVYRRRKMKNSIYKAATWL